MFIGLLSVDLMMGSLELSVRRGIIVGMDVMVNEIVKLEGDFACGGAHW